MIYVDALFACQKTAHWPYEMACHLMADTEQELHTFATGMGLLKRWYQDDHAIPHYDLTPRMRRMAIRLGAREIATIDEYQSLVVRKKQPRVIPFGYADGGVPALERLMQDGAYLVDIRLSPRSRMPAFNQNALQARFQKRYIHMPDLGNVNYRNGEPIKIAHPGRGISRLVNGLNQGYTLILMCGCKDYESCHRHAVVDLLQVAMPDVRVEMPDVAAPDGTLKCLSIQQPWSWLIVNGYKDIENREWTTSYRGPVLIHAGARLDSSWFDCGELYDRPLAELGIVPEFDMPARQELYPVKSIVGMATLVDVVEESGSPWFVGRYGFVFQDARLFEKPIPYSGSLKLFDIAREVVQEVIHV